MNAISGRNPNEERIDMTVTYYPTITICGSMRYFDKMLKAADEWTQKGYIVLMPFVKWIKPKDQKDSPVKTMLDDMHFTKIGMSEAILVVGEHRGESTTREIEKAREWDLEIFEYEG